MSTRSKISVVAQDEPSHKGVLFVKGIPRTTKNAFKAACASKGITMRDALIQLMRKYVESPTV